MTALKRIPIALAALVAGVVLLVWPAAAAAAERDVPRQGPLPTGASVEQVTDTVFAGKAPRMRAARVGARVARVYAAPDGQRVEVEASRSYASDPAADQALVDFLGSRLHGSELGSLRVYVGTPSEIEALCGGDGAMACYAIAEGRMYVPGEAVDGIPVEYPLTHEYGHHIASWRSNEPWDALDWGPKYWSSARSICAKVRGGLLFPGDQGGALPRRSGRGLCGRIRAPPVPRCAVVLQRAHAPGYGGVRGDPARRRLDPWSGPRSRTFRGTARDRRAAAAAFHIRMHLDGDLELRLAAPRGDGLRGPGGDARLRARGDSLRGGGSFGIEWCRQRSARPDRAHGAAPLRRRAVRAAGQLARLTPSGARGAGGADHLDAEPGPDGPGLPVAAERVELHAVAAGGGVR